MKQRPVAGSQHAPLPGLQTNGEELQVWPGTLVPPARAQVVTSRLWHDPQQQHAGGCLEQLGKAALHEVLALKTCPSCWQVPDVVMVQTNELVLQHAP